MSDFEAKFVTEPVIAIVADMSLKTDGLDVMAEWVRSRAPVCLPEEYDESGAIALFPHEGYRNEIDHLTDNELLVELAGRKCYNSFGAKAGRKTNAEYIANLYSGDVPHRSVLYHAKMSFFIAGVSRRVSHELIRNYVGSDRDEEGSPSQESTRYVENAGFFVVHPRYLLPGQETRLGQWKRAVQSNYENYRVAVSSELFDHEVNAGSPAKGMDYKRILEAASSFLSHSVETSWIWTTNPEALAKLIRERDHDGADLEFRRLARAWKRLCLDTWPNLFPQPWMRE